MTIFFYEQPLSMFSFKLHSSANEVIFRPLKAKAHGITGMCLAKVIFPLSVHFCHLNTTFPTDRNLTIAKDSHHVATFSQSPAYQQLNMLGKERQEI
jgi:hypothetical protein